ncbi:MAG: YdeI/OmpD-associated family protein [Chloroflexi bacterium]|nr:YdeI/OmpD-associated family protein [Chloroflexota bacterium]
MDDSETVYALDRGEWRSWLKQNHLSQKGVWLVYYKKHTRKPSVPYNDAVEEAICFGWIDGKIRKLDEDRYMQRYTPRKARSAWSEVNIERAKRMVKAGRMTPAGLDAYEKGMKDGRIVPSSKSFTVPEDLREALMNNSEAWRNFAGFAPSAKLLYCYWVDEAKTQETRLQRIAKTVELAAQNRKHYY